MNTRIARLELQIEKEKEMLAKCIAFCEKFPSIDSKEKCLRQQEYIKSLEDQLARTKVESAKMEVSETRRAKHSGKWPILEQVTGGKEAWDLIDAVLEDKRYETDDERKIALDIQLTKLSQGQ